MSDDSLRNEPGLPERAALDRYARTYASGHVLFEDGQPGDRMYVIGAGKVRIVKRVGAEEVTLATLGDGDFFGEMALLEGQPRSATAIIAAPQTVLIEVERETFAEMIRGNGEIALRLMRRLSSRLREATQKLTSFLTESGTARALDALQAGCGNPADDGWRPLPDFFDTTLLATRAGLSLPEARDVMAVLTRCGLLIERDERLHLAPPEDVDEYRMYLRLKARFDPLTVQELAEMSGLPEVEVHKTVQRLLEAKLADEHEGPELVDLYRRYLALKRRFEYPDVPARDARATGATSSDARPAGAPPSRVR